MCRKHGVIKQRGVKRKEGRNERWEREREREEKRGKGIEQKEIIEETWREGERKKEKQKEKEWEKWEIVNEKEKKCENKINK